MNEKCGYYSDGECNICGMGMSGEDTFCRLCKDNQNCYYKQLDKLRTEKDKYYQQTLDDEITLNELYQVLQEIKEKLIQVNKFCTTHKGIYDDNCIKVLVSTIIDLITKAEEE